jgi:hypothetical protein
MTTSQSDADDLARAATRFLASLEVPGSKASVTIAKVLRKIDASRAFSTHIVIAGKAETPGKKKLAVTPGALAALPDESEIEFSAGYPMPSSHETVPIPVTTTGFTSRIRYATIYHVWSQFEAAFAGKDGKEIAVKYHSAGSLDALERDAAGLRQKAETAPDREGPVNEDAIDAAVAWWTREAERRFQNYGHLADLGGVEGIYATVLANKGNQSPGTEKLAAFSRELKAGLIAKLSPREDGNLPRVVILDVDYGPCRILGEAMERAGFRVELPWKTCMWIKRPWHVIVRKGMTSKEEVLYATRQALLKEAAGIDERLKVMRADNAAFESAIAVL